MVEHALKSLPRRIDILPTHNQNILLQMQTKNCIQVNIYFESNNSLKLKPFPPFPHNVTLSSLYTSPHYMHTISLFLHRYALSALSALSTPTPSTLDWIEEPNPPEHP